MPSVPNTNTFNLQDVVAAVVPTTNDLIDCFSDAIRSKYNPLYSGSTNNLLNFRDYNADNTLTDLDGNVYTSVIINGQEWLKQPLITTKYGDNTSIPLITGTTAWTTDNSGGYCFYNNSPANKSAYGILYSGNALLNAKGLVYILRGGTHETGWRSASMSDWTGLSTFMGGDSVAGGKMKITGTTYWDATNVASDVYGLGLRGGGHRVSTTATFEYLKQFVFYHAFTSPGAAGGYMYIFNGGATFYHSTGAGARSGHYVRCVRDVA